MTYLISRFGSIIHAFGIIYFFHVPYGVAEGWAYDDSGVYYQPSQPGSLFMIPYPLPVYPILKVKVPKEYLSPEARQAAEAREAKELAAARVRVVLLMVGGIGATLVIVGLALWWRYRTQRIKASRS